MKKLILAILAAFVFSALPPATAEAAQASDTQKLIAGKKGHNNSKARAKAEQKKKKKKQRKKKQKREQKRAAKKAARKARRQA